MRQLLERTAGGGPQQRYWQFRHLHNDRTRDAISPDLTRLRSRLINGILESRRGIKRRLEFASRNRIRLQRALPGLSPRPRPGLVQPKVSISGS